jgi:hypothetical protein
MSKYIISKARLNESGDTNCKALECQPGDILEYKKIPMRLDRHSTDQQQLLRLGETPGLEPIKIHAAGTVGSVP